MTTGEASPGWYDDPAGHPNTRRWWDGSAWTDDRMPGDAAPPGPHGEYRPPEFADTRPDAAGPVAAAPLPPPVLFEVVEPDHRRRRVLWTAGIAVAAVVAASLGYVLGTSGDDDKAAATAPTGQAATPAPAASTAAVGSAPAGAPTSGAPTPNATTAVPPPPPPSVPPQDATAHWLLNGTSADAKGTSPATATGSVTWSPGHGGSAVFTGNGALQTQKAVLDTTKSFTVAAWAKVDDTATHRTIVAQDGTQVSGFYLHYNKDAKTWAFVRTANDASNPSGWFTATAAQPPRIGAWTHLAGVYDATARTLTLYVDGVPQPKVGDVPAWAAKGPLTIGRATSNVDRFHGAIADVRVYARPLADAEIAALASER